MGQSGGNRVVCSCRLTMRLPYLTSLLLVATVIIADPDVFGDYFDDGMKLVDISQDTALRSCLSDGKTADKTKAAYDECYGQGYDFDDLAKAGGDDDGLPDELEEKEACFYKKMGWVSEDNVMDEAAIAADMEGLENQIQEQFNDDVGTCVAWSGSFGKRRRREAGMEVQGETQDTQDRELVPGLMDTGRRAMGWVKKLVRKVRSPGNKNDCPKGKEGRKCRQNAKEGKRTGLRGKGGKKTRPKKKRGRKPKNNPGKGGKGRTPGRGRNGNKGRPGRRNKGEPERVPGRVGEEIMGEEVEEVTKIIKKTEKVAKRIKRRKKGTQMKETIDRAKEIRGLKKRKTKTLKKRKRMDNRKRIKTPPGVEKIRMLSLYLKQCITSYGVSI